MASSRQAKSKKHGLQDIDQPGTSSSSIPAKRSKTSSSKSSESRSKEEMRLHQAIERSIQKAIKEASIKEIDPPTPVLGRTSTPARQSAESSAQAPGLSPDGEGSRVQNPEQVNEALFGVQDDNSPPAGRSPPAEAAPLENDPPQAEEGGSGPLVSPELAAYIHQAILQGLAADRQRRTASWVSESPSQIDVEGSCLSTDGDKVPLWAHSVISASAHGSVLGEDLKDPDLSDDEDLSPDLPSFVGLFKPQMFRSLLHKAKLTTGLGSPPPAPSSGEGTSQSIPLFEEPTIESEEIPGPKLFREVLTKQWSTPASGPNPNALDRRIYNMAPEVSSLLQVPTVDAPVAALSASSNPTGPPEEGLRPEERRLERILVKSHQGTAWSIKSALAASFFNRASILWLRQLQARLPVADTRSQQDINKVIAALEFSADATLNASRFAAKTLGTSITARRLLWLRQWQADVKSKWRLATAPFGGPHMFGASLEPLLVESRDKRKFLPAMSRRSDHRSPQSFPPFRGSEGSYTGPRNQRPFSSRQSRPLDRQGFQPQRGQFKRPFCGGRGRPSRRSR